MKDLQNANAIVTGASRGLGVHIARALASSGVNVAVAARSAQQLEAVRAELVSLGVKAVAIRADATVAAERQELVDRAAAELGPIDILVNNAGTELASRYTQCRVVKGSARGSSTWSGVSARFGNGGPVRRGIDQDHLVVRTSVACSVCHRYCCCRHYQDDHHGGGGIRARAPGRADPGGAV